MRTSISISSLVLASFVAACGGGSKSSPDAPAAKDIGFDPPMMPLMANMEGSGSATTYTTLGPANLSCLGTASTDVATTTAITLNTQVTDFQEGDAIPSAAVTAFAGTDYTHPFGSGTSDATTGDVTIVIPAGTKRYGFEMTAADQIETLLLFQYFTDPTTTPQTTPSDIQSVSNATAQVLPALIGQTRIQGTGVVAGALRDCDNNEISNFVSTMSSTSGTNTPIDGAEAYYFSATGKVPVRYSEQDSASQDGLFMEIQVPTATTSYIQLWGFKDMT